MKSFETVYNQLSDLFINKLPDYINKTNEEHNDGLILKNFANKDLSSKSTQLPYFTFSTETATYSEKDRIIENTVYEVSFEIKLENYTNNKEIIFWRYVESMQNMLREAEIPEIIELEKVEKQKIYIKITLWARKNFTVPFFDIFMFYNIENK